MSARDLFLRAPNRSITDNPNVSAPDFPNEHEDQNQPQQD